VYMHLTDICMYARFAALVPPLPPLGIAMGADDDANSSSAGGGSGGGGRGGGSLSLLEREIEMELEKKAVPQMGRDPKFVGYTPSIERRLLYAQYIFYLFIYIMRVCRYIYPLFTCMI
jgi:hypothetical protein